MIIILTCPITLNYFLLVDKQMNSSEFGEHSYRFIEEIYFYPPLIQVYLFRFNFLDSKEVSF